MDINIKILDNYMHTPGVHNDKSQRITMWETIDKFFDELLEILETSLSKLNFILNMGLALKQEYKCYQLPQLKGIVLEKIPQNS